MTNIQYNCLARTMFANVPPLAHDHSLAMDVSPNWRERPAAPATTSQPISPLSLKNNGPPIPRIVPNSGSNLKTAATANDITKQCMPNSTPSQQQMIPTPATPSAQSQQQHRAQQGGVIQRGDTQGYRHQLRERSIPSSTGQLLTQNGKRAN